jgi:hypothetical protein
VAQLVKNFKIDLSTLDEVLANVVSNKPAIDPVLEKLEKLEQQVNNRQQEVSQSREAEINNVIEKFATDAKNEFFTDVAGHMQALLANGHAKDLQEAYDQACWANPKVRAVMQQREQAKQQKAKAANVSIAGSGPRSRLTTQTAGKSTRDILRAEIYGE